MKFVDLVKDRSPTQIGLSTASRNIQAKMEIKMVMVVPMLKSQKGVAVRRRNVGLKIPKVRQSK